MKEEAIKELASVLDEYNSKYKKVDFDCFKRIYDIVIKINNLEEYCQTIELIEPENDDSIFKDIIAAYSNKYKKIIVNKDCFNKGNEQINNELYDALSEKEKIIINNFYLVHTLLHELEHARQHKQINSNKYSYKKHILTLSLSESLLEENINKLKHEKDNLTEEEQQVLEGLIEYGIRIAKNKKRVYPYLTSEKMAEADAWYTIKNIYKESSANKSNYIENAIDLSYYGCFILGYEINETNIIPPILSFYTILLSEDMEDLKKKLPYIMREIEAGQYLNTLDKMYYGFKITAEEYKNYEKEIKSLISKLKSSSKTIELKR